MLAIASAVVRYAIKQPKSSIDSPEHGFASVHVPTMFAASQQSRLEIASPNIAPFSPPSGSISTGRIALMVTGLGAAADKT
jgi:hypothetical protein